MVTVSIEEAQGRLGELIDKLLPGEEVVITRTGPRFRSGKPTPKS